MIENQKNPSNCCKYCGWEFQNDIIQKIIEEQESAVCEFCGIEINISSISPQEGITKENYGRISNSKDKVEKKKKSIVKSISKLTKTKKYSVNVILGDKDFPKIFKENLIVVISRLIYKYIGEWEQDNNVNIHQVGLTQTILITLAKKVKPIIDKRIHSSYLENLHKITLEEFEEWLKLLQKKFRSIQEYRNHFLIYLLWLTKIMFRLVSDMWEMKNLPKFQATIIKDLKKYPVPLREVSKAYNLQELFDDGERKECGRCHEIKSINEYGARMSQGKKRFFSRCKDCRLDINQIYQYKNKVKIIQNIYNGKLNGKCQMCNTDLKKLPSFEFHHLNPKLKSVKGISMYRNWEQTMRQIENEKATILCTNCHTKQRSTHYIKYEKIIQENKLTHLATNNQITQYVKNKIPKVDYDARRQVVRSIKKLIVINYLYEGKCVGCGDVSTKNNLPALQFHHIDKINPYIMSKTYVNLRNLEIKNILKRLRTENCVPLCGNCHRMEQSIHFKKNFKDIIKPAYWNQIKEFYDIIEKNLREFKFKEEKK